MAKERNRAVPAVYLILQKNNQILLMRRQGSGYYDGWYSVPAGHVDAGELPVSGLIREVNEELGVVINPKDVQHVHTLYRTKHDETGDRIDLFFVASKWSGEITNTEPHKCDDIRWFPIGSMPDNVMHHVKGVVENIEKGIQYSELAISQQVSNPKAP